MTSSPDGKTKFDPIKVIGQLFAYAKHLRIMILMGALGITAGLVYFLFSTPTYSATSLVFVQGFGAPIRNIEISETFERAAFSRSFLNRFSSQRVRVAAAQQLGLVGDDATFEDSFRHVPQVLIAPVDIRHLEITIIAYEPEVVRNFAEAMVESFQRLQEESWNEYRDEALQRYAEQVQQLEDRITENIESLTDVERDQNLTAATLEQQSLLEIPKKMIQTRERLRRMDGIRSLLTKIESGESLSIGGPNDDPDRKMANLMRLLSLLGQFEKDTAVSVGDIISTTGPRDGVVGSTKSPEVVVQPADIAGLEPWRELEKQMRVLEDEIAEAAKTFGPENEVMQDLNAQLDETRRALVTESQIMREKFDLEYAKLGETLEILESRMPEYHAATEQVGKSAYAYSSIADQQQMWDQARERLTAKLASVAFSEDFDWIQVRYKGLISIRDEIPVSPSKRKLVMLSLIIGITGALGVSTLINLFDTSATNLQQLEETTGLKGIGIVPLASKENLEQVHRSPAQGALVPNYLLECFRVIRSNICLHPNHRDRSQVILVTSSRPQEGKTTQAANLAWAFQSMGEQTLLLDCDLRRGRVHSLLGIDQSPGMTRLLLGEVSPQEAIVSPVSDGFDVIPRGAVIAGTTELLCQRPFEQLIELFRKHYDRIVIDSPPVLGLSESSSLQRIIDGTVLVVRAEKTSRKDVVDAITVLQKSDAHFFGFVLNAVDLSQPSNYYHYYYYSAPYYDQFVPEKNDSPMPDNMGLVSSTNDLTVSAPRETNPSAAASQSSDIRIPVERS